MQIIAVVNFPSRQVASVISDVLVLGTYSKQGIVLLGLNEKVNAPTGFPYNGAKERYILDIDDRELCFKVINILEPITKIPQKKKK